MAIPSTQKAILQPDKMSTSVTMISDHPTPTPDFAADEHLIRVHATAITNGELLWSRYFPLPAGSKKVLVPCNDIAGTVVGSVIGPGVRVAKGAVVEDSVVFAQTVVEAGAEVRGAIVDSRCTIAQGARVGETPPGSRVGDDRLVLVGRDSRVARGSVVGPGARLEPGSTA